MRGGGGVVGVVGSFGGALGDGTGAGRGFGDATFGSFGAASRRAARGGGGAVAAGAATGLGLRSPRDEESPSAPLSTSSSAPLRKQVKQDIHKTRPCCVLVVHNYCTVPR